jgi:uncharacterized membrane protein YidH (DUF202 family)
VLLDAVASGLPGHQPAPGVGVLATAAGHHIGLILALIGIAIILRGGVGYERTRRAIDREGTTPMPRSHAELVLSAAVSIAASMFCVYLAFQ